MSLRMVSPPATIQQVKDVAVVPSDIVPLAVPSSITPTKSVPVGTPEYAPPPRSTLMKPSLPEKGTAAALASIEKMRMTLKQPRVVVKERRRFISTDTISVNCSWK